MKKYTADDIEIAILTFNRAAFLQETLDSILAQTVQGFKISVMDNCSTDTTKELVARIIEENPQANINYFRHEKNVGGENNAKKAAELATKPYILLFHDDDILHPSYIEYALNVLNKIDNVSIISTRFNHTHFPDAKNWEHASSRIRIFENDDELATFIYGGGKISFPCVIYKTDAIRTAIDGNLCGKVGDMPQVIRAAKGGKSVVFSDGRLLRYRRHPGQDSHNLSTGPFDNEIIAHVDFFKKHMESKLANRIMFAFSYPIVVSGLVKFAGKTKSERRYFLRRMRRNNHGGILAAACSIPIIDNAAKFGIKLFRKLLLLGMFREVDI